MNIDGAVERACQEKTLLEALVWIAVWENDRAVQQARENETWETCFKLCFQRVMDAYRKPYQTPSNTRILVELPEYWTVRKEVTYLVFERVSDCEQSAKLTFHLRKGYQWRLHKLEGEVRAFELAEITTLLRFMDKDEWDRMEDSHIYEKQEGET